MTKKQCFVIIPCCLALIALIFSFTSLLFVVRVSSDVDRDALLDTSLYDDTMKESMIDTETLLRIYSTYPAGLGDTPLEETLQKASQEQKWQCVAFGISTRKIFVGESISLQHVYKPGVIEWATKTTNDWLTDIRYGGTVQIFCGKLCIVREVFVCQLPYLPTDVFYVTNRGVFVRSYSGYERGADFEMPLETYQKYSADWKDSKTDLSEIEDPEERARQVTMGSNSIENYIKRVAPNELKKPSIFSSWLVYRIGVVVLVFAAGITAVVIYNKRKKATPPQEEQPPTEL